MLVSMLNNNDIMTIYCLHTILESVYVMLGCMLSRLFCEGADCEALLFHVAGLVAGLKIGGLGCCTAGTGVFGFGICNLGCCRRLTIDTETYEQYYNEQNNLDPPQQSLLPFPSPHHPHPP